MVLRKFGPKEKSHPSVGTECPACHKEFKEGDYTTLIPIGPGDNRGSQEKAKAGLGYNAVAVEVHWDCADPKIFHTQTVERLVRVPPSYEVKRVIGTVLPKEGVVIPSVEV